MCKIQKGSYGKDEIVTQDKAGNRVVNTKVTMGDSIDRLTKQ